MSAAPLKIALGHRLMPGAWGGGNMFAHALAGAVEQAGHRLTSALDDADIDIVLLTDPRRRNPAAAFGPGAVLRYLAFRNPNAVAIHRINECDLRKGTDYVDAMLARANYVADATVFVGAWLQDLPVWQAAPPRRSSVIRNGADARVFNASGGADWRADVPLRLVTHHWGFNPLKGFDVYEKLDRMLGSAQWASKIAFTYIGNLPADARFAHAKYLPPLHGEALAAALKQNHVYVTASQFEPGGNHQNEGAACGLPLLYRNSGCMPEYCAGFGEMFDGPDDFENALGRMLETYAAHRRNMHAYPWTAERMCVQWLDLFATLAEARAEIAASRNVWRAPLRFLANQASWR